MTRNRCPHADPIGEDPMGEEHSSKQGLQGNLSMKGHSIAAAAGWKSGLEVLWEGEEWFQMNHICVSKRSLCFLYEHVIGSRR